ncbi:MAG: hypothetical protein ABI629_06870 [bacterium]
MRRILGRGASQTRGALAIAALFLCCGCTPRPLLERAIAARGGPLHGVVMTAEARLYRGLPGIWRYTRTFLAPDRYAWQVETSTGTDTHLFDGAATRSFVGSGEVGRDTNPAAPLRTQVRWTAVSLLDRLAAPDVVLYPLLPGELPSGAREGLLATFPDGAAYRLAFDEQVQLVWMRGPLDLSPLANGQAEARFSSTRRTANVLLPMEAQYEIDGYRLADETLLAVCVDPPGLTAASFADVTGLPPCPAPTTVQPALP